MALLSNSNPLLPVAAFPANHTTFVAAFPANHTTFVAAILRTACPLLRTSMPSFTSKPFLRPPKAIASPKNQYPDHNTEFAVTATRKFKYGLLQKLSTEKDTFGDDLRAVVDVCAERFNKFLCEEYEGSGTLLIEPFTDMMVALNEKNLPGAVLATRASLLLAQEFVDQDWEVWKRAQSNR